MFIQTPIYKCKTKKETSAILTNRKQLTVPRANLIFKVKKSLPLLANEKQK
jgi:hypothetical protein